jgi:1-acyl-sn-glycerol-3-phosphate acyltransferase
MKIISAFIAYFVKTLGYFLYRTKVTWHTPEQQIRWEDLRLIIVLNHTSLFEFLYITAIPYNRIWRAVKRIVLPVADVTMKRPLTGIFLKTLVPNAVPITRKRDETWDRFMTKLKQESALALIFPEGRMKRKDGLDKHGKPMSVKGGVADILEELQEGKILVAYSKGLHHVQAPGDYLPKIFKTIHIGFEQIDIPAYKDNMRAKGEDFRLSVIQDLEAKMKLNC